LCVVAAQYSGMPGHFKFEQSFKTGLAKISVSPLFASHPSQIIFKNFPTSTVPFFLKLANNHFPAYLFLFCNGLLYFPDNCW
jgi:hypothetical protein